MPTQSNGGCHCEPLSLDGGANCQSDGHFKIIPFTRSGRSRQLKHCIDKQGLIPKRSDDVDYGLTGTTADRSVFESEIEKKFSYSVVDMLMAIFSMVCYLVDIVLEIRLAVFYYAAWSSASIGVVNRDCQTSVPTQSSYMVWFFVTVALILLPGMICGFCSLSWHITDFRMQRLQGQQLSIFRYSMRFLLPLLLLGPVLHNVEAIVFALGARALSKVSSDTIKTQQRQIYLYEQALFEDADAALLRIIECFLESLPQLIIQMHIVLTATNLGRPFDSLMKPLCNPDKDRFAFGSDDPVCSVLVSRLAEWFPSFPLMIDCQLTLQLLSMAVTLLAAAWALVSYQRALRRFLFSRRQMLLFPSGFVLFLAHTFLISGRVLAIVLFVQVLGWAVLFGVLVVHSVVMFVWLHFGCVFSSKSPAKLPEGFCCADSAVVRGFFNAVLALIYTTAYVNVFDSPTRYRYVFFFSLTMVENVVFLLLWFFISASQQLFNSFMTRFYFLIAGLSLVFGGVLFLLLYYKFFHPNVFRIKKVLHTSTNATACSGRESRSVELTSC